MYVRACTLTVLRVKSVHESVQYVLAMHFYRVLLAVVIPSHPIPFKHDSILKHINCLSFKCMRLISGHMADQKINDFLSFRNHCHTCIGLNIPLSRPNQFYDTVILYNAMGITA